MLNLALINAWMFLYLKGGAFLCNRKYKWKASNCLLGVSFY